jgi:hypothetical protein
MQGEVQNDILDTSQRLSVFDNADGNGIPLVDIVDATSPIENEYFEDRLSDKYSRRSSVKSRCDIDTSFND